MLQRWLGTVLLYGEKQFRRVNGGAEIAQVIAPIEAEHAEQKWPHSVEQQPEAFTQQAEI